MAGATRWYCASLVWSSRKVAMSARVMLDRILSRPRYPARMVPVGAPLVGRGKRTIVQSIWLSVTRLRHLQQLAVGSREEGASHKRDEPAERAVGGARSA